MKAVIFGSNSFIGGVVKKKLLNEGWAVEGITRNSTISYNFPHIRINDLFDEFRQSLISSDLIVWCAAEGVQPEEICTTEDIFEINTFEPIRLINLLEASAYQGEVVTFGSYFEIGNCQEQIKFIEEHIPKSPFEILNNYSLSKSSLTHFISRKSLVSSLRIKHLILTNVYGYGENTNRLIPYIINQIKEKNEISLTSGEQVRQYTHVRDIGNLISRIGQIDYSGILNFSNPETISIKDLVQILSDKLTSLGYERVPIRYGAVNRRDIKMPYLALDIRRILELNDAPFTSLSEGLDIYLKDALK